MLYLLASRQRDPWIEMALYHRELQTIFWPGDDLLEAINVVGDTVYETVGDQSYRDIRAAVERAARRLRWRRALRRGMRRTKKRGEA